MESPGSNPGPSALPLACKADVIPLHHIPDICAPKPPSFVESSNHTQWIFINNLI